MLRLTAVVRYTSKDCWLMSGLVVAKSSTRGISIPVLGNTGVSVFISNVANGLSVLIPT
nr:hypothetical protein [Nonlabens ulvanivorans]